jgi:uncharacterized protein (TIGR03118 family)
MRNRLLPNGRWWGAAAALPLLAALATIAAAPASDNSFTVHNLVSDGSAVPAQNPDPNLINSWGIARSASSAWWVANADSGTATLYDGAGNPQSLIVQVPGNPTGTVFNGGASFVISDGTSSGPARFLFASEDGTILGWSPAVPPPPLSHQAFVAVPNAGAGASYKGLAIATTDSGDFLYAADFHNARVDVFDGSFHLVTPAGAFVDPGLPQGYAPFGIQNLLGQIYVAYAKQDEEGEEEVAGEGLGFVSVFDTAGRFLARVASRGPLNAPWGMTIAPAAGFGRFSGNLLVGNFGDGRINAYDLQTFEPRGHLKTADHHPLAIDGLWGIGFGNGGAAGPITTLYFASGPQEEAHGLFGSITLN